MAMQLLLSLSILVTLHEFGHFWAAKRFGMRVEKFYLFFDIKFSVWKQQIGETEYGIGWLPLGGYVKIAGMMDESMDKEALAKPPQEWEFRSKPAWQRLIVMIGGVTLNFLLGIFLFATISWLYGDEYLPNKSVEYGIATSPLAQEMGFKDGDQLVAIGDHKFQKFNPGLLSTKMLFDKVYDVTVLRNGQEVKFTVQDSSVIKLPSYSKQKRRLVTTRMPFVIGDLTEDYPGIKAGFKIGDSIYAVNGTPTPYFTDFVRMAQQNKENDMKVTFSRDGAEKTLTVQPNAKGRIGAAPYGPDRYFEFDRTYYGFFEAYPVAVAKSYDFLATQIKAFGQMFTGRLKATESLGGFISIGQMFPPYWDWEYFWRMTAMLSLILGFMNLLPIPALDGGHVMFLMYEIVARRPVSEKVLEFAQVVGIILLIGLLLFANGNDIYGLIKNWLAA